MKQPTAIVAYIPVLHAGYFQLFKKFPGSVIYILGRSLTKTMPALPKDLRALDPLQIQIAIESWNIAAQVYIADELALQALADANFQIVLPDEDISRLIADRFFGYNPVIYESIFLRWDRQRSEASSRIKPDRIISGNTTEAAPMKLALQASRHSSDIWRRIGAAIEQNGRTLVTAYNIGQPTEHSPWIDGDPRNNYRQGSNLEASLFIHAEALAVAMCAKRGQALAGASLYVTTFPCPVCARLIANCGIKCCYYTAGYSMLDAVDILRGAGVELIRIENNTD